MRYDQPLFLCAPTVCLGERSSSVAAAIEAGLIREPVAHKYGYTSLTVSDRAPVELAERAAADALRVAAVPASDLTRVCHAWTYHQGHEFWSPAHYVAARVGATAAVPVGIQQMCNGGVAAVEVAAREMVADAALGPALVTTGDRFAPPEFDRWGGDLGVCYGDGATAVVLTRTPAGPAGRILAIETTAAAELEAMHRGDLPFTTAPRGGAGAVCPKATKKRFNAGMPSVDLAKVAYDALTVVITGALASAGIEPDDPRLCGVALPRLSRNGLDDVYLPAIGASTPAPPLIFGTDTGHLGAGDVVANLADLLAQGRAGQGDMVLLIGAGAGFTWSAVLVAVV